MTESWPRKSLHRLPFFAAGALLACSSANPPHFLRTPPPADLAIAVRSSTATPDAGASEPDLRRAEGEAERGQADLARFFPGPDPSRPGRTRKATAVLLYAPPGQSSEEAGIVAVERLRFQPMVCSIRGKLAVGARCGEAMPARATVRLTDGGSAGRDELELQRSTAAFHDQSGEQTYPAPYGPACCMYNTCVGKTVPYFPIEPNPHFVLTTTKAVLAVWPVDAEINLTVLDRELSSEVKVDDGPWLHPPEASESPRPTQTLLYHGRRYAVVSAARSSGILYADLGSGWQRILSAPGARDYYMISTSDIDGDGRPEILVHARWANDYGLHLLANEAPKPLYGFSCGNI